MSYIAKHIIGADERLIGVTHLHKIYLVAGLFWAGVFFALALAVVIFATTGGGAAAYTRIVVLGHDLGAVVDWVLSAFILAGVAIFFASLISVMTTEVALTSQRIIYKRGWIMVQVEQIEIEEIESERIRHGLLGSWLGYGSVLLDCRFIKDVHLPVIPAPYKFIRAMHKQRDHLRGASKPATP